MDQDTPELTRDFEYEDTLTFCESLIAGFGPTSTRLEFRALWAKERGEPQGAKSIRVTGTLDHCCARLCRLNKQGYGIFLTVNETDEEGVKAENITGVRALWADWDDGRPDMVPVEPSIVIRTSPNRFQAYWLLGDEMTKPQFKQCMERIVVSYGGDKNCKDVARVLRVPGFFHTKAEDWRVRFAKDSPEPAPTYKAARLVKAFPSVEEPTRSVVAPKVAAGLMKMLKTDQPFDAARVKEALDCLPGRVADDYSSAAVKVCAALKRGSGGSEEGRVLWHEFAARSKKYTHEWAEEKWDKGFDAEDVGENRIKLGTLFLMAAEHGFKASAMERLANLDEVKVADSKTASEFGLAVETWTDDTTKEFFSRMNREHALVSLGSSIRYLHDYAGANGKSELEFRRAEDMKRWYANITVPVGDRKLNGFDAWDRWKERRQCTGVGLFPGEMTVPSGYINLWRGFAVEPCKGQWSLFDDHLHDIVCSGNEEYYVWLIDWLAHLIQHPDKKPGSAVVLKSAAKGTGKSMIYQFLSRILGVHAMSVAQAGHVVGNFNGHLLRNILLGVEEAFWAGNKSAEGVIKNLITEPTITIEKKGIDPISAPNFTRLLINSNESWTVPVGIDERRFLVLEVNNKRAKDPRYFDPIFKQMKNGGLEAMLHSLLEWDIKSNLRNPPETKALEQEREYSLSGVHRWVCEVARAGCVYDKARGSDIVLSDNTTTELDRAVIRDAVRDNCTSHEARCLDTRLGLLLKQVGVESGRPSRQGRRARVYVFPPLHELRSSVERVVRVSATGDAA